MNAKQRALLAEYLHNDAIDIYSVTYLQSSVTSLNTLSVYYYRGDELVTDHISESGEIDTSSIRVFGRAA